MSCFNISLWLCLWLVLFFCSVLKDSCKLCVVEHPILDRSLSIHFIHFIISEPRIERLSSAIFSPQLGQTCLLSR